MNLRLRNERSETMARKHLSRTLAGVIAASAIIAAPTGVGATAVVSAEEISGAVGAGAQDAGKPSAAPEPVRYEDLRKGPDTERPELTVEKDTPAAEIVVKVAGVEKGDWVAFSYFLDEEKDAEGKAPEHNVLSDEDEAARAEAAQNSEGIEPAGTWWQAGEKNEIRLPADKLPETGKYTLVAQGAKDAEAPEREKAVGWHEVTAEELPEVPRESEPNTPDPVAPGSTTPTTTTGEDGGVTPGTLDGTVGAILEMFGTAVDFGQEINSAQSPESTANSTKSSRSTAANAPGDETRAESTSGGSDPQEPEPGRARATSGGSTSGGPASGGSNSNGSASSGAGSKSSGSGSKAAAKSGKSSNSGKSGKSGKSAKATKAKSGKSTKAEKAGSKPEKAAKNPVETTDELKSSNAHGVKGALEGDRMLLTVPEAEAGDWLYVYVFSDDKAPEGLGWMKVDKNKQISVDTSDLGPGVHKFALVNEDDKLVGWNGVQFPDEAQDGAAEKNVAPQAESEVMMGASDWSLIAGSLGIVALSALGAFVWWRTRTLG